MKPNVQSAPVEAYAFRMSTSGNPPRATYRLQMHKDFPFAAAQAILPQLAALGVSHVYLSPITAARRDSRTATTSLTTQRSILILAVSKASSNLRTRRSEKV